MGEPHRGEGHARIKGARGEPGEWHREPPERLNRRPVFNTPEEARKLGLSGQLLYFKFMGGKGSGGKSARIFIPAPDREAFDRQPDETDQAWAGFVAYRDLGTDRTVDRAVPRLGKKPSYRRVMEGWSMRWGWRLRVVEWDRATDRRAREAQLEGIAETNRQMMTVAEGLWKLAGQDLALWHEKLKQAKKAAMNKKGSKAAAPLLTAKEIEGLANTGIKLQRMLLDQPSEILEMRERASIDDRRRHLQRLAKDPAARDAMRTVTDRAVALSDEDSGAAD